MDDHEKNGSNGLDGIALGDGEELFRAEARFVTSALTEDEFPPPTLPEVAFAGRSNVGKSSLINRLAGRRNLAYSSKTPGRTQRLNFFAVGERLMLVDLPGYGFNRASKKTARGWHRAIDAYLAGRANLVRMMILIDARHGMKDNDRQFLSRLGELAIPHQLVLTKADKISAAARAALTDTLEADLPQHPGGLAPVIATSARDGGGIGQLRDILTGMAIAAGTR